MANLKELRGKETEDFITESITGLKTVRRLAQEAIKDLRELEREIKEGDSRGQD